MHGEEPQCSASWPTLSPWAWTEELCVRKEAGPAWAQEHFQKALCVIWEQGRFLKQKGKIINKESRG